MSLDGRTYALIGLGRMGLRHVEAAERLGLTAAALLDTAEAPFVLGERPDLAAARVPDLDALIAAKPDVAVLATTAPAHAPLTRALMAGGIGRIVIEKPMTSRPADAYALAAEAEAAGARLVVNHGRRYSRNYAAVRAMDGSPETGRLRSVVMTQGGGGLGCMGVHYLDLAAYLFGEAPREVYARLTEPEAANPRGAEFHDPGGIAMMHFSDGRRAVLEMGDDIGVLGQIELRFEKAHIRIGAETEPWALHQRKAEVRDRPKSAYGAPVEPVEFPYFQVHTAVDAAADVIADALSDAPPICGAETSREVMAVLAACHLSHARGAPVALPLSAADLDLDLVIP